jgi:hypothetical protein
MTCVLNATRTRNLPLRRSSRVLGSTAAFLVGAGFLVLWLPPDIRRFRLVLARGWHAPVLSRCLEQALPGSALGNPPD